ncbi:RDD family protein [Planococcus ruber]|uniref:RDD family protein n=1 Tax=Planococcus ruber TaxID=2027871 RepID=UPI001FEDDE24|nr:RDD family protein [Planococcus ruber]MCJ1907681.1 RDD family protein [Planococcus ruber]
MDRLTKKRVKGILIDTAVSTAVSIAIEQAMKKKVKNSFFYAVAAPSLVLYGLEYAQLRRSGQTIGHKAAGIQIQNENGGELTPEQIIKRMLYRDTASSIVYLKDPKTYNASGGAIFPHDVYAGTVVKEV